MPLLLGAGGALGAAPKLKITSLKTYVVDAFRCNWVFVKIGTDQGLTGVGEGTTEMNELTVEAAIRNMSRYLMGKDPFQVEYHTHILRRESYWRNGVILRSALAAVEAALLDIKGQALGVPVYELLGGRYRDRIKCYANGWFTGANRPEEFGEKAAATVKLGFQALKFDPFGKAYLTMDGGEQDLAVARVAAVREAVGPRVDILIEVHGRLDVPTAVAMGQRLAPLRPLFYEEPVLPENLRSLAEVKRGIPFAVASGERFYDVERFQEALRLGAVDYLQPDVIHVGGMLETKRVCSLALMEDRPVSAHNPNGPVCNAMTLQIAASTPNFVMLETLLTDVPWRREVAPEELELVDGHMKIPDKPGLGVELNEAEAAKHPYTPHDLRHYTGALTAIRPPDAVPYWRMGK
ncbi:MAG: galactonate dehydratase [Bryobacter sp.]|jgi:galactonate dehydratase|nr:galactonate dehydratase [Bryobacter sp. CoA8 C33]